MPAGSSIRISGKSAYVTSDNLFYWLKNFLALRNTSGKIILIFDGYSSHCASMETFDFCTSNYIILLCLPKHTTHYLDRDVFKLIKRYYYSHGNLNIRNNLERDNWPLEYYEIRLGAKHQATDSFECISEFVVFTPLIHLLYLTMWNDAYVYCISCVEPYKQSKKGEKWIQCSQCKK